MRLLADAFTRAGIEDPTIDARLLLCAAAGFDHSALIRDPDLPIEEEAAELALAMAKRRLAREPVSRILGERSFWSFDLLVTLAVLDPRPDTETVVDGALEVLAERQAEALSILDLGTGSGALLCALLDVFPQAQGLGVDLSKEACANVVFVVFPYALIFRIRCYELQVLAVMQMRRRPGYWKARDGKLK